MTQENNQKHSLFHIDELIKMLVDFKTNSGGDVFFDKCNIDIQGFDLQGKKHSLKSRTRKYKKHSLFHIDELIKMLVDFKTNSGGDVFFDKCNIDIQGFDLQGKKHSLKSRTRKYKKEVLENGK